MARVQYLDTPLAQQAESEIQKLGISEWSRDFATIVYRRLLLQTTATSPYLSWPPPSPRGAAGA